MSGSNISSKTGVAAKIHEGKYKIIYSVTKKAYKAKSRLIKSRYKTQDNKVVKVVSMTVMYARRSFLLKHLPS